ncbi:hypothetical protein FACS1894122_01690 [Alphaproteobacteria bacterium]|nr:hypothetical protein FACS1894122_01690 [Alphaproteobacteria bacterium]
MKRILMSSCVLAMLLTIVVEAEATLERLSSCADLLAKQKPAQGASTADEQSLQENIFSVEEYQDLLNKFYDQNKEYLKGTAPDIREEATVSAADLYRLGKLLGFKEYKLKGAPEGSEGIPTIDLSWPNIRRVFEGKAILPSNKRAERLKDIIKAIDEFKGFSHTNFPLVQKQIEGQANEIIKLCLEGNEKLFDLEALDETCSTRFKEHLKQMLVNYTGFQRIMSLLAVSILNSIEEHAFVPGFTKIGVVVADDDRSCYLSRRIKITKEVFNESNYYPIFHESTHAYHHMILGSFRASDFKSAYPILNSANADFIGLLFPTLTDKKMKLVVDDIARLITSICDIETIKSHIKDDSEIINIFKKIIDGGFGSMVFSKKDLTIKEKTHFDLKNILTPEMLAKAIYVHTSAFAAPNVEDNFIKNSNKANFTWGDGEEILAMVGLMPMTNSDQTYLLEDRQHDEIRKIRFQEGRKKYVQLCKQYKCHSGIVTEYVFDKIAWTIDVICKECADANSPAETELEKVRGKGVELLRKIFKERQKNDSQNVNKEIEKILMSEDFIKPEDFRFNSNNVSAEYEETFSEKILKAIEKSNKFNKLHIAVSARDASNISSLAMDSAYLNAKCTTGETPLHLAILGGDINTTRVLLWRGASPNITNQKGETPLHLAVKLRDDKAIKALRECCQTNLNATNNEGRTPLHLAARSANVNTVNAIDILLDAGADPNIKDSKEGFAPLHLAAEHEIVEAIKRLCKCKRTNINEYDKVNFTPLHLATYHGKTEAIKALIEGGADPDFKGCEANGKGTTPLYLAILKNKDIEVIRTLLDGGAKPNTKSYNWTPLCKAVDNDRLDIVKALLDNKADPNIKSDKKFTPLYLAILDNKDIKVIEALLNGGADPDIKAYDWTPLRKAASNKRLDIVEALIDGRANPNIKSDEDNLTPLSHVVQMKDIEKAEKVKIIKALLVSPIITIETVRSCKSDDQNIKEMLEEWIQNHSEQK